MGKELDVELPLIAPQAPSQSESEPGRRRTCSKAKYWAGLALVVTVVLLAHSSGSARTQGEWNAFGQHSSVCKSAPKSANKLQKYWAQYSPYKPVAKYEHAPHGCSVSQVNLIQRHGARYPSSDDPEEMESAIIKLQSAETFKDKKLKFLKKHSYFLGRDDLIPLGAQQSFESGSVTYDRYSHLVSEDNIPFVRASGMGRVIDTATNWSAGFATGSRYHYSPKLSVIIPEDRNDTLQNNMCPNAPASKLHTHTWGKKFTAPIHKRLNNAAPGAKLDEDDIIALMTLCPLETIAFGPDLDELSGFCGMFTKKEWKQYEYFMDLKKYYHTGYGNELGPVQGVGYVNELVARLTGQSVNDSTQTNSTLDLNPETFPLNRTIYADFSHENTLVAIFSAIGLFKQDENLDSKNMPKNRHVKGKKAKGEWVASRMVPFSTRMVAEKLTCGEEEKVRILVNDEVQPLAFCGDGDGICTLDRFVESLEYARNGGEGDWEKCGWEVPE